MAVTHPLSSFGGSTPSRRTYNTARSSNGRMRDPHSRDMGSIPIRVTDIAKWRNRYTRDAQNVVSTRTCEFDSRLGYLRKHDAGATGVQLAFIRPVRSARYRDLQLIADQPTVGARASAHSGLISRNCRVQPPDPLLKTAEYANRQSGHVESVAILWVRLPLWSLAA